ncbi:MAG: PAS domain S-box protein [Rhodospirillaceae bacterium]
MPQTTVRSRGVAFRLLVGLSVMAALAVTASLVGRLAVDNYRAAFQETAATSLPNLVEASQLAQTAQSIIGSAPALVLADSQPVRRAAMLRINDQLTWMRELVDRLNRSENANEMVRNAARLGGELGKALESLSKEVGRRIDLGKVLHQLSWDLDALEQLVTKQVLTLLQEAAAGGKSGAEDSQISEILSQWLLSERHILTLLALAIGTPDPETLERQRSTASASITLAETMLAKLPPALGERLLASHQRIACLAQGEGSVFAQIAKRFEVEQAVRTTMIRNKELSDDFFTVVTALTKEIETGVLARSEQIDRQAGWQSKILFVIAVVCALGAVVILIYINSNVIRRLRQLVDCMLDMVDGNRNVSIPITADDEIGDLGRAFRHFVVTIDAREAALKEERERIRLSELKFSRTFDQAPIGASIVSLGGNYTRANREFERITGYSEIEICTKSVADITYPDDREVSSESAKRLLAGEISQADEVKRYLRKDGEPIWVHVSVRLMKDDNGTPLYFIPMMVDITERRSIEIALNEAKERAESTLEDLLATQNNLVEAEKMASLGRLVAGAAHEINTPIGVALTTGSLLSDRIHDVADNYRSNRLRKSEMETFIEIAEEASNLLLANIRRAADLVQSFKQVAADQISEQRRKFDLGGCLSDVVYTLGPVWRHPGHNVDLICPEPIEVEGYPGVISQILTNLIANSVVHAFEHGHYGILTIMAVLVKPDCVVLTYRDNGKGISPSSINNVFEPFFTTRRNLGSTGLGLHIVYNLVVGKLGGRIDLKSDVGQGVCFTIRFPRIAKIIEMEQ